MKTLEQVTQDALSLPLEDQGKLCDNLVTVLSVDPEREKIEGTLQDRVTGEFIKIEDPEAHFAERRRYFDEKYADA